MDATTIDSEAADAGTKVCPDCAETVQEAAKVCKHCSYRFEAAQAQPPAQQNQKSKVGAVLLNLLLPGIGSFYLGEVARGAAWLVSALAFAWATVVTDTIGPGFILAIFAAFSAAAGAQHYNDTGTRRDMDGGMWIALVFCVGLSIFAVAQYDPPASGGGYLDPGASSYEDGGANEDAGYDPDLDNTDVDGVPCEESVDMVGCP